MLKAECIKQAYAQIRISGLTVDPTPEDYELALWELDQMMQEWAGKRRLVNYNFPPPTPDDELSVSNPSDNLAVYDWARTGVIMSLAARLVEYFGKPVPPSIVAKAKSGINVIRQNTVGIPDVPYPNRMPRGSGNTFRVPEVWRYYMPSYTGRPIQKNIAFSQIMDCSQDFTKFLADDGRDEIVSYTIKTNENSSVRLLSDSRDGNVINFRVEAYREYNAESCVTVEITTENGLVMPQVTRFDVQGVPCSA